MSLPVLMACLQARHGLPDRAGEPALEERIITLVNTHGTVASTRESCQAQSRQQSHACSPQLSPIKVCVFTIVVIILPLPGPALLP